MKKFKSWVHDLKFKSRKVSNRKFSQQVIEIKASNVDYHDRLGIQMVEKTAHTTNSMLKADYHKLFIPSERPPNHKSASLQWWHLSYFFVCLEGFKKGLILVNTFMCCNYLSQWWVEFKFKLSWLDCLLTDSKVFILSAEINQIILKIYFIPILLTFMYLVALYQKTEL